MYYRRSTSGVATYTLLLYFRSVITQAKYDDSSDDERLSTIVVEDQLLRGRITKPAAKNRLDSTRNIS